MLSGGRGIDGLDRLDVRLVALLGLALLPIGIIAMVQTYRVIDEADRNAEAALAGVTLTAATGEREEFFRIRGAARVTAAMMPLLLDNIAECSETLAALVAAQESVSFGGYVDETGIVRCGSEEVGRDISDTSLSFAQQGVSTGQIKVIEGIIRDHKVVAVTEPVYLDGERNGYVVFSVPQEPLEIGRATPKASLPLVSLIFTRDGDVLSWWVSNEGDDPADDLPVNLDLAELPTSNLTTFEATSLGGGSRFYTVAALISGEIFAMSIWHPRAVRTGRLTAASALLFPLLMWLVSIGVAYFAVHRLVVRHIRNLRLRIRAFTANRKILPPDAGSDTPSELREVIETFHQMTERIVRDEADLENSLHEKDVLLKEVHHRVKNNLQLISSMMNMQLRRANSAETRFMLRRLQDRVLGLATIHRNLYQASVLSRVNSEQLIADLVEQILRTSDARAQGINLSIGVDPVPLYPDQAVPLSLLVTETITNALKYVGRPSDGPPWIDLSLRADRSGVVVLRVANSVGTPLGGASEDSSTGLGTQLMGAFVMQLDATSEIETTDEAFIVSVTFRPSEFAEDG